MSPKPKVEAFLKKQIKRHGTICAALIDPEDFSPAKAADTAQAAAKAGVSIILVGGSTVSDQVRLNQVVRAIKRRVTLPVMLFPNNVTGVSRYADAILFSSLLNSTNPYFIVGAQALGAMEVFKSGLESIPMGYLVFGGSSATSFIGQVNPLPLPKPALAVIYALAARYLGMRTLYLEAGSGASDTIPTQTIELVRRFYDGILIVGGGITSADRAERIAKAGTDILVIGNLLQTNGYEKALRQIVAAIERRQRH
ncbi:MAG: geranylgeranylglyceryl/heptaprenylglyceryl phosphate synthase [Nitrososphaerales archaeon]|nr:geranylgeranylglyceryl/heptaprenylglyceryl phosphate synthase [Nitrososphaerales archaeon]